MLFYCPQGNQPCFILLFRSLLNPLVAKQQDLSSQTSQQHKSLSTSELVRGSMFSVEGVSYEQGFHGISLGPARSLFGAHYPPQDILLFTGREAGFVATWTSFVSCRSALVQKWRSVIVPRWRSGRKWSNQSHFVKIKKLSHWRVLVPCLLIYFIFWPIKSLV